MLVEHGGKAAKVAAPVAMEIIRDYFRYVAPPTAAGAASAAEAAAVAGPAPRAKRRPGTGGGGGRRAQP